MLAVLVRLSWKAAGLFLLCGIAYGPGANALSALGAGATSASHAVLLLSLFPPLASLLAALVWVTTSDAIADAFAAQDAMD